jgi:hypothetical protein
LKIRKISDYILLIRTDLSLALFYGMNLNEEEGSIPRSH